MVAKYIVLSNIISIESDHIFHMCIKESLLIFKKSIISIESDHIFHMCIKESLLIFKKSVILFHTLSAYNSLLVGCKIYSSDPRECLCTQAEGMMKNPIKNKLVILNCQPLLVGENDTERKS